MIDTPIFFTTKVNSEKRAYYPKGPFRAQIRIKSRKKLRKAGFLLTKKRRVTQKVAKERY